MPVATYDQLSSHKDDSISGNKIHGGVISAFSSQGIEDLATQTTLRISNDRVSVDRLRVKELEGEIVVHGSLSATGKISANEDAVFKQNVNILGELVVETLTVKNATSNASANIYSALEISDLNDQGICWVTADKAHQLIFKSEPIRFWSSETIDLRDSASYQIGNVDVLSSSTLGNTVVFSSLKTVGELQSLTVAGKISAKDAATFEKNVSVLGELVVEKLTVNDKSNLASFYSTTHFDSNDLDGLNGKGLTWAGRDNTYQFVFRSEPKRIWSSETLDLHRSASYQIDNVDVLSSTKLGDGVVSSNLTSVGTLKSLKVSGTAELSNTIYVNPSLGRLGINTDQPNAALSVVDELIEIAIGSYKTDQAYIGTWGPTTLNIGVDNTAKISIYGNTVTVGSQSSQNALLKVFGRLEVQEIVSDTRVERTSPIEFLATADNSIYGKGLSWVGAGVTRQLYMLPNPDRIHSTESFSIDEGKSYRIGPDVVLEKNKLGDSILSSNLKTLGTLDSLAVSGEVNLAEAVKISNNNILIQNELTVVNDQLALTFTANGIQTNGATFAVYNNAQTELSIDTQGNIQLGHKENTDRVINLYGKIAINVTNPPSDSAFTVNGTVVINGKKQVHAEEAPTEGRWNKGDIAWNSEPQNTSYIGWVCVQPGTPGSWKPFGYIGERL